MCFAKFGRCMYQSSLRLVSCHIWMVMWASLGLRDANAVKSFSSSPSVLQVWRRNPLSVKCLMMFLYFPGIRSRRICIVIHRPSGVQTFSRNHGQSLQQGCDTRKPSLTQTDLLLKVKNNHAVSKTKLPHAGWKHGARYEKSRGKANNKYTDMRV